MQERLEMTEQEIRQTLVPVVRAAIRSCGRNPMLFSADQARWVLDDLVKANRASRMARWYRVASSSELSKFYSQWNAWQRSVVRYS